MTTTPKNRRGPKPKTDDKKQSVPVMLRLTEDEINALDEARGSTPRGTYIRNVYLQRGGMQSIPTVNRDAYAQLARSAANINQLARYLNGGGEAEAIEIARELADFRRKLIGVRDERDE